MPFFSTKVPQDYKEAERLDKYIASVKSELNRSKLKAGLLSVQINGKKAKLSSKINANDEIILEWEDNIPQDIKAEDIPLDIIYEDENVTVINKKQGMVTHPAAGNWEGTLVNALLYHWGKQTIVRDTEKDVQSQMNLFRPGIVHRLDKDTSGVIITARNRNAEEFLIKSFKNHSTISKIYIAICKGHPKQKVGIIRTYIRRDMHDRKKFAVCDENQGGKLAISKYKVVANYGPYSLIKVKIYTGRTHQIRVHLKSIGCPILGDPIYSKTDKNSIFYGASLMLHAYKLKIRLPDSANAKQYAEFKAKVPLRFKKVIKTLHDKFGIPQNVADNMEKVKELKESENVR